MAQKSQRANAKKESTRKRMSENELQTLGRTKATTHRPCENAENEDDWDSRLPKTKRNSSGYFFTIPNTPWPKNEVRTKIHERNRGAPDRWGTTLLVSGSINGHMNGSRSGPRVGTQDSARQLTTRSRPTRLRLARKSPRDAVSLR